MPFQRQERPVAFLKLKRGLSIQLSEEAGSLSAFDENQTKTPLKLSKRQRPL
jgi:hypothetical protein